MASEAPQPAGDSGQVPNQLAWLVPTFDPAVDNVEIWSSKVELLLHTWPTSKVTEFATRLILGCKGTAYQKLQLHKAECLINEVKGIRRIVELVGGTWGQVPLEKKFELVEKALYRSSQKSDETGDSYLSRCDVVWTELISKGVTLGEIRAYIVLRGSRLGPDDKKRVIVESGAESGDGELDIKRVTSAIRMLASGFFQDLTGMRREKSLKTYDHTAFTVEENPETDGEPAFWTAAGPEELLDDHILETMAAEDDEDAALVMEFEDAIADTIQSNTDIAAFYTSYQEARKRLSDKVKYRGFWSVRKGFEKGGKKGKMKHRGKGGSLASRIANSYCRICMKKGHWKNECPSRGGGGTSSAASSTSTTSVPTSFVFAEEVSTSLASIEEAKDRSSEMMEVFCLSVGTENSSDRWGKVHKQFQNSPKWVRFSNKWSRFRKPQSSNELQPVVDSDVVLPVINQVAPTMSVSRDETSLTGSAHCLFASHGSIGVIDLGASQTVIGDRQVPELLQSIPMHVRSKVKRVACNLCFRFGNHQTLTSHHALSMPLGKGSFRVAVVPGNTPFLLSSSFLKGIKAVIDTDEGILFSKLLQRELTITSSSKNLFLMDINQLWDPNYEEVTQGSVSQDVTCFVSESKLHQLTQPSSESFSHHNPKSQEHDTTTVFTKEVRLEHVSKPSVIAHPKLVCPVSSPLGDRHVGVSTPRHVSSPDQCRREPESTRSSETHVTGDTVSEEDRVWTSQTELRVPGGVRGSEMDRMVHLSLRSQPEGRAPNVHRVCQEATGSRDGEQFNDKRSSTTQGQDDCSQEQKSKSCSPCLIGNVLDSSEVRRDCGVRSGESTGLHGGALEQHNDRTSGRTHGPHAPGPPSTWKSNDLHGERHAGDPQSRSWSECQSRTGSLSESDVHDLLVSNDFVFQSDSTGQSYSKIIQKQVKQFQKEHLDVFKSQREAIRHRRLDLLEVMCSSSSELTNQMMHLGGSAMRFGMSEGDLSTHTGRAKLFEIICKYRPKHLWFSPECGPWCLWSNLNMNKSLQLQEKVLEKRHENLWQISLGIVMRRLQQETNNHFHMEQPNGSMLWQIPGAQELSRHTKTCQFDLCQVGKLRDPKSGDFIRKRLIVETTSSALHRDLHGRKCDGSHNHRQVAGNTIVNGKSQSLSAYTALYPSRFARCVARILKNDKQQPEWVFAAEDHPTKRRRLTGKWDPADISDHFQDINWPTVMMTANSVAPRVGTIVIESGKLVDQVQRMCPQHIVKHVVLCKGMDRRVGPNKTIPKGEAPMRKVIGIHRTTGQLVIDDEWEHWERLTLKGLRRKGEPLRLGMTIFANVRINSDSSEPVVPTDRSTVSPDVSIRVRPADDMPNSTLPKRPRLSTETELKAIPFGAEPRETIDLISQKHGPLFQALKKEEQSWILKLHRNLGHPGAQKLVEFCRQLGCPDRILHAIPDVKCSTCAEVSRPKISRPSAIHEPVDFGEIVSMDGITWSNSNGQSFNIYHMIDQSTSYHTAIVTQSKTSEQAIQALLMGWLQWAGPPGTLVVDAATELNSEEFTQFLQRHNICCRTIATDAHWQNSRIERHGGILQVILNKMDKESPIDSIPKLQEAVSNATSTKNQWSRHRGYPPEILVFGKSVKVPGSVINEGFSASNALAINPRTEGQLFREQLAVRERARKAFTEVDNDQTLRRALVHRSRPSRGTYCQGEWVMIWKKRGEADGTWQGPMQVITQDGSQVVWVSMGTKLFRVAPEHVRSLSAVEEWKLQLLGNSNPDNHPNSVVPRHGGTQYHDLIQNSPPNPNESSPDTVPSGNLPEVQNPPEGANNPEEIESHDTQSQQPDGEPDVSSMPSGSNSDPNAISGQGPYATSGDMAQSAPLPEPESLDPSAIPVPESASDDELFVDTDQECYALQEDQCWCLEVEVNNHDIAKWKHSDKPHEMSFLVSAAKRQRSEVKMSTLSPEHRKLFAEAKDKEVSSWLSTNTVARILRHQVPTENILRCRWILTWKPVDPESPTDQKNQKPKVVPKARLVVLGYEDPLVHEIPRDSPTMSKLSRMLILQQAASRGWEIESFDIKTAFLRGNEVSDRVLGMEPPEELRTKMKLQPLEIVRLLKGAYGRVDAPYLWFMELKRGLEDLGFIAAPFDPCTFVLPNNQTGQIEGLVGIHVDDGLCCGSQKFQQKLMHLKEKFPFGSHKRRNFTFTGFKIDQSSDFSITVNQEQYVKDIQPIVISRSRKDESESPITEPERQALRALVGSLQYAAVNTRPDICSRLGWLQSRINTAKVSTLIEANRTLNEAKMHAKLSIKVQPIDIKSVRFIAFSDASFASNKEPDSHQGMIIMACDEKIQNNQPSVVNPIVWHSKKIQKVAVSTLSAEAMALAGSVDVLSWIRLYWGWMMNTNLPWKLADETLFRLPPAFAAIPPKEEDISNATPPEKLQELLPTLPKSQNSLITTDCKSLYDMISRTAPPSCQEFRTQLQAKLIKEHLRNGIMIRWVPSGAQMADALTKVMDGTTLRECLTLGRYCLKDENDILKARSDSRARVQWLRQNAETHEGEDVDR